MNPIAKALIGLGIVLILAGICWQFGSGFLGKLPGDVAIKRQNVQIYFPFMTSILLSVVLLLILWLIRYFSR